MTTKLTERNSSKTTAGELFNRYVWLVDTIYRAGRLTYEEINERWTRSALNSAGEDLPLKTFHNHKNAIQQMFDINIECDRRGGYVYYIENAEDMEQGGVRSWLLNTFAVNNLINESHHLKRRILFEEIPSGQQFLTPIIEAMRDSLRIEMTYRSFWRGESSTFEVEPFCIKVFRQRWYLVAQNVGRGVVRVYGLDRIEALQITENQFKLPPEFDAQCFFEDSFGVIVDMEVPIERVRIRIAEMQRQYVRSLPLHASQQEIEIGEEESIFEYRLRPTIDFQQELLTNAVNAEGEVEVLEPLWLRKRMQEIGIDLVDSHNAM